MNRKKKIKILSIVGARPNFMKIAPLFRIYKGVQGVEPILVHTNQHSDEKMSGAFFKSLGIPDPHHTLQTDNSSPLKSIHTTLQELERVLEIEKPDLVLVVGDVNSTLAGALAANKSSIKIAHVEAGLRSGDRAMPEEINRILVDHLSDMLFVTEQSGLENLKKEGVAEERIHFVGNVMIDNLIHMLPTIDQSSIYSKIGVKDEKFILLTMHRPANVDHKDRLLVLLEIVKRLTEETGIKIIFPIHPRTLNNFESHGLVGQLKNIENLVITEPLDYIDFMKLARGSALILTDSGGIQEEAAYLKIPTITLRESTERPSTIESGANRLHSMEDVDGLLTKIKSKLNEGWSEIKNIPLWDGLASQRIVDIIIRNLQ